MKLRPPSSLERYEIEPLLGIGDDDVAAAERVVQTLRDGADAV